MWLVPGGTDAGLIDDVSSAVVVGDAYSEVMGMVDAGDVDGDGTEDVWTSTIFTMDGADTVGSASLFLGPFSGSRSKADEDLEWLGIDDFDMAGFSLAAGADLDGDALPDMVMAAIRRPELGATGPWEMGEPAIFTTAPAAGPPERRGGRPGACSVSRGSRRQSTPNPPAGG